MESNPGDYLFILYNGSLLQNKSYAEELKGFEQYFDQTLSQRSELKDFNFIKLDVQDPQNEQVINQPLDYELGFGIYLANEQYQQLLLSPTPEMIDDVLSYSLISIDDIQPYHVTGELDLLDAYETFRHHDAVVYLLQRNCSMCHQIYIEALKFAAKEKLTFYSVNCSESVIASWVCTRRNPRSNPWVQLLINGKFYNYDFGSNFEFPSFKNIQKAYYEAKNNTIQPELESQRENFTVAWMDENPTRIVDGQPVEWPMRPNRKQYYEKIEELQQRLDKINEEYNKKYGKETSKTSKQSIDQGKIKSFIKKLFK